jgi:2-alkyl-3-oxoalkanoate reductase
LKETILVTGYGGFLGKAICKELIQAGYRVRGLARNLYPSLESLGIECIVGSASERSVCEQACRGVHGVIHTAALAGIWGAARRFEEANVKATAELLSASKRAGAVAFVQTSSPSVTFDGDHQSNINESAPYPKKWLCHYPRTKAISEQEVLHACSDKFATCALRPHLIWGVGDPHLIPRVIDRCKAGRLRRIGSGRNLIDTVHVDCAARAHRQALDRLLARDKNAMGRAFFLTDGQPIECWEWISQILSCADIQPPKRSMSFRAAYNLGAILECAYSSTGIQSEPPMTRFVAAQLGKDHYFDIASAKQWLGYEPLGQRERRIEELRAWLVGRGSNQNTL